MDHNLHGVFNLCSVLHCNFDDCDVTEAYNQSGQLVVMFITVGQLCQFSQDNHILDLSIYCYMTWTCRFNFGGVDDLREALPASSMQHTDSTGEKGTVEGSSSNTDHTAYPHGLLMPSYRTWPNELVLANTGVVISG